MLFEELFPFAQRVRQVWAVLLLLAESRSWCSESDSKSESERLRVPLLEALKVRKSQREAGIDQPLNVKIHNIKLRVCLAPVLESTSFGA